MTGLTIRRGRHGTALRAVTLACLAAAVLVLAVLSARWAWNRPAVAAFVARYPGVATGASYPGTPVWVAALHALNVFFLAQIVRSGLALRRIGRPIGHWSPPTRRRSGEPVTVEQWFHVALDLLWLVAGAVFVVLMVVSGRWVRLVPTSWDVFPNALSAAAQYLSLHWPPHDGWVAYNALQMLCYFGVVFVLAPLAAATGLRMSLLWPARASINRWFTVERSRAVHTVVMVLFIVFAVVHIGLVAATGAVRALDHMFTARNDDSPLGVLVLAGVLVLTAAAIAAARPAILRALAGLTGRVTR